MKDHIHCADVCVQYHKTPPLSQCTDALLGTDTHHCEQLKTDTHNCELPLQEIARSASDVHTIQRASENSDADKQTRTERKMWHRALGGQGSAHFRAERRQMPHAVSDDYEDRVRICGGKEMFAVMFPGPLGRMFRISSVWC